MQILCTHDYGDIHKWELYEDIWGYLCNTFTKEPIEEQEWYRRHPEYFLEILPEINIWKTETELKVSALDRRYEKLFRDKELIEKELENIKEILEKLNELWSDRL